MTWDRPQSVTVRLSPVETDERQLDITYEVPDAGVVFEIGTGRSCDLQLPREDYPFVPRKACRISVTPNGVFLDAFGVGEPSTLDGEPVHERPIAWGEHELILFGSAFRLEIVRNS